VRQAAAADADQHLVAPGSVPAEWRELRTKIRVTCPDVYFVDVDDPATHTHLLGVLAAELHQLGVENLDVSTIRGPDRRVTRLVSLWAYMPRAEVREGYAGIRYESRLGPWECWAVFDDVPVEQVEQRPIELDDPAMLSVANDFGLRIF